MTEVWGVAATYEGDRVFRRGARLFVLAVGGARESAHVWGVSRGGRAVEKWVPFLKLSNFRAKMAPPNSRAAAWYTSAKPNAISSAAGYTRDRELLIRERQANE